MRGIRQAIAVIMLLFTAGGVGGCVERTISITSDPPGALAYLNDEEVGRTPVKVPFTFYGVYNIRLIHDHYLPLTTTHDAKGPWWEAPGPDLFGELIPGNKVNLDWHFTMQPMTEYKDLPESERVQYEDLLMDHAGQMRATLRQDQPATQPAATQPAATQHGGK